MNEPMPYDWSKTLRGILLDKGFDPDDPELTEEARKFYHDSGLAEVVEYDIGWPGPRSPSIGAKLGPNEVVLPSISHLLYDEFVNKPVEKTVVINGQPITLLIKRLIQKPDPHDYMRDPYRFHRNNNKVHYFDGYGQLIN